MEARGSASGVRTEQSRDDDVTARPPERSAAPASRTRARSGLDVGAAVEIRGKETTLGAPARRRRRTRSGRRLPWPFRNLSRAARRHNDEEE